MTLERTAIADVLAREGAAVRVLIAESRGSAPRAAGTAMLVWADGFTGTIGGGALEWQALAAAREVLRHGGHRVLRLPLGPALGQCCGGAVILVLEHLEQVPPDPWVRRIEGDAPQPDAQPFAFVDGWLMETQANAGRPVWIWGAGHVGAALAWLLAPLPELSVTCVDHAERLPDLPPEVRALPAADLSKAMVLAPPDAAHIILTYSHEIDLALCHGALRHGFGFCGVIGSATKWARFRSRLSALGHGPDAIARITCPIGERALGKHPQAIAIGVARGLLSWAMDPPGQRTPP
ncbi:xanthine dehydrogenase accessory protein XdhC [Jannaschia pagri]|uniref:Xanthine dehydrogenase accessory protein XdhC n=1 Tax=Jannaschia pagri TaxID=2829797 RepID=A0ABQ4NQJ3_9RHOB|nr:MULTISPECIES: xanthine dehydrogenase accessory protein XdhC [unclassified Jannaschia]GIT92846.1 xanthine dehydrogenase accessory protein XdhC [Jannaschia sp. AI_61]GIT96681.1 xanthine dehydrogenase accessory protein XdhC [Jannaschia sp. AI_62]